MSTTPATPSLYVISTPIGHPDDITFRALRLLREVRLIAATDVPGVTLLLRRYDIPLEDGKTIVPCDDNQTIFAALDAGSVALVAPMGTPGIDEALGAALIREAIGRGGRVEPIPGASALIPALVASGLATDNFKFVGELRPEDVGRYADERMTMVATVVDVNDDRLDALFTALAATFGDSHPVSAAIELSTPYENILRGTVADLRAHFAEHEPEMALTLVIGGVPEQIETWDEARVRAALQTRLDAGDSLSYAAKAVASESGWRKSDVYELGKK